MSSQSFDLVKTIVGLIVALIPILAAVVKLLENRTKNINIPLDNISLKGLAIKRNPVNTKDWEKIKRNHNFFYKIVAALFIFTTSFTLAVISNLNIYVAIIAIVLSVLGVATIIYVGLSHYSNKFQSEYEARYYLFNGETIEIKADYPYLFKKCYEAIKNMHYEVVEVDETTGTLEAYQIPFWAWQGARQIKIDIKKITDNSSKIVINFVDLSLHYRRIPSSIKIEVSRSVYPNLVLRSKTVNTFINELVSKAKNTDDKEADKKEGA